MQVKPWDGKPISIRVHDALPIMLSLMIRSTLFALDAPVLDQGRRQCRDRTPIRQQHRQRSFGEILFTVVASCQPVQIGQHGSRPPEVSVGVAVARRERQHRTPAPLAAMDRLGDATAKMDRDLSLHQVAVAGRDAILWPSGRVDVRCDADAAPLPRGVLGDLDVPDGQRRCRARQPWRSLERNQGGAGVASLMMGDR